MNKRLYPLFFIDRAKHEAYPFDYVICTDRIVGFVARVVFLQKDDLYFEFLKQQAKIENANYLNVLYKLRNGGIILVAEDFFMEFEFNNENKKRIQTLLKKGLKKYLHAEVDRTPFDDLGIDNQILQQEETLTRALANYTQLLERCNGDKELADYQIDLSRAILESLKQVKHNDKFYKLIMN